MTTKTEGRGSLHIWTCALPILLCPDQLVATNRYVVEMAKSFCEHLTGTLEAGYCRIE